MGEKHCSVCGRDEVKVIYEGPIRQGKPGNLTATAYKIFQCTHCQTAYVNHDVIDYESDDYRELVNDSALADDYYTKHDFQQTEKVDIIGLDQFRGKKVADIGTGAGSFLDLISTVSTETLAIEPTQSFHASLKEKGHKVYNYAETALPSQANSCDIVTSFAVIEHIANPVQFLQDAFNLTKPGGLVIISTPNHNDFLIDFLGQDYKEFYYRSVHKWYFNEVSLTALAEKVGFKSQEFIYKQQYDISNMLYWLKDKKPTGLKKTSHLSELNPMYKSMLESQKKSNYLYVVLQK